MPVRKLNYTKRKTLAAKDVPINIVSGVFEINNLDAIRGLNVPSDSLIVVEPYLKARRSRVHYATVGNPVVPPVEDRRLDGFSRDEDVLFRIKIVDPNSGKLLAETREINPRVEGELTQKSLLPVNWKNGVEECWRIDFDADVPTLIIDKEIGKQEKSDNFLALVYPAILREMLAHILFVEKVEDTDDEDDRYTHWLRFAQNINPDFPKRGAEPNFEQEAREWIDSTATSFAERLKSLKKGKELFRKEE